MKRYIIEFIFYAGVYIYFCLVLDAVFARLTKKKKRKWFAKVGTTMLVHHIIAFTNDILKQRGISCLPSFSISYYKHRRFIGLYKNSQITIYIKNADDVVTLISIVLHEVCHFIQDQSNPAEFGKYEAYSKTIGYQNNPLEIESRQFAEQWIEPCLKYLESTALIGSE